MAHWLNKKEMTEEDIKLQFITPAIQKKWGLDCITMETKVQLTDGKINLRGNIAFRESPKKADYVLYQCANNPIAIVEAKDNNHSVSYGIQQAKEYAKMLDVPFAYSSNGDAFCEFDFLTGQERKFVLDEFPSPEELIARYRQEANLSPEELSIITQPYYSSQETYPPRYYQQVAINRTLDAIARKQQRILLVMATGTGKTYTAFQIVYRLLKSGMKRKILYLADRNNLVDQSIEQDFSPLSKTIHKVDVSKDTPATITSYEVYFALYQQLEVKTPLTTINVKYGENIKTLPPKPFSSTDRMVKHVNELAGSLAEHERAIFLQVFQYRITERKERLRSTHYEEVSQTMQAAKKRGVEFWEVQMDFRPEGVSLVKAELSTDI